MYMATIWLPCPCGRMYLPTPTRANNCSNPFVSEGGKGTTLDTNIAHIFHGMIFSASSSLLQISISPWAMLKLPVWLRVPCEFTTAWFTQHVHEICSSHGLIIAFRAVSRPIFRAVPIIFCWFHIHKTFPLHSYIASSLLLLKTSSISYNHHLYPLIGYIKIYNAHDTPIILMACFSHPSPSHKIPIPMKWLHLSHVFQWSLLLLGNVTHHLYITHSILIICSKRSYSHHGLKGQDIKGTGTSIYPLIASPF